MVECGTHICLMAECTLRLAVRRELANMIRFASWAELCGAHYCVWAPNCGPSSLFCFGNCDIHLPHFIHTPPFFSFFIYNEAQQHVQFHPRVGRAEKVIIQAYYSQPNYCCGCFFQPKYIALSL